MSIVSYFFENEFKLNPNKKCLLSFKCKLIWLCLQLSRYDHSKIENNDIIDTTVRKLINSIKIRNFLNIKKCETIPTHFMESQLRFL